MEKSETHFTYGHTGDIEIIVDLKKDAQNGFKLSPNVMRSQVNPGGGQKNVSGAAALRPFVEMGLLPGFDFIVANSSAAANAAIAKCAMRENITDERADELLGIYYRDNVNKGLVRKGIILPEFDIDTAELTLKSKELDFEAVRYLKPDILIPVTYPDGTTGIVNLKDYPDPWEIVADAMAPIILSKRASRRPFHDGSFKNPLPLSWAIERGSTEIVTFLTNPIDLPFTRVLRDRLTIIFGQLITGRLDDYQIKTGQLKSLLVSQIQYLRELQLVKNPKLRPGVRILAFHPLDLGGIDQFCMDGVKLKQASDAATAHVRELLQNL